MKKTKGNKPSVYAENILKIRNRLGMTQSEFAESIGLTLRGYQDFEYGKAKVPGFEIMERIADLGKVDIRSLSDPEGPKPIKTSTPDQEKAESLIAIHSSLPSLNNDELRRVLKFIKSLSARSSAAADSEAG
jgi:transcriptional regulator with XRE-family HTH domain